MTEIERLMELLEEKDQKIAELEGDVREATEKEEERQRWAETFWTRHVKLEDDGGLPVPRLEIRWERDDVARSGYQWRANYNLVYRHFLGDIIAVPLGRTMVGCEHPVRNGKIDTPFRDGAHIRHDAAQLGLPAYSVCENITDVIETRPKTT